MSADERGKAGRPDTGGNTPAAAVNVPSVVSIGSTTVAGAAIPDAWVSGERVSGPSSDPEFPGRAGGANDGVVECDPVVVPSDVG